MVQTKVIERNNNTHLVRSTIFRKP